MAARSYKREILIALGVVGALFLLAGLSGAFDDSKTPEAGASAPAPAPAVRPATIEGIEDVTRVLREDDALLISARIDAFWNEQQLVDFSALTVERVGKAIQAGAPQADGATWVSVDISAPSTDRLGQETISHFATLTFPADDLKKARFENLSSARLLNLATDVRASAIGRHAIAKWCAEPAHGDDGAPFCNRAL